MEKVIRPTRSVHIEALLSQFGENPFQTSLPKYAALYGDRAFAHWLDVNGKEMTVLTWAELWTKVRLIHCLIKEKNLQKGDRVMLCFAPGLEFIISFLATIISGLIAVPAYPPDPTKGAAEYSRYLDLVDASGSSVVFTHGYFHSGIKKMRMLTFETMDQRWDALDWVVTDNYDAMKKVYGPDPEYTPTKLERHHDAFFQFTSGSTGRPKGVMVTLMNLLHNIHYIGHMMSFNTWRVDPENGEDFQDFPITEGMAFFARRNEWSFQKFGFNTRVYSWLPSYHDMGQLIR